jgi:hypothetical protein
MTTYYVYVLIDPRDHLPFYIGKGSGDRAKSHLCNLSNSRNQLKESRITSIKNEGFEPLIEYLIQNITNEDLAYELETAFIQYYGRQGYESHGILTNICICARPPNHKGKSYDEIYGVDKAKSQREMRSKLQKERGGYGPKKHSDKTKSKISKLNTGLNNSNSSGLSADDILKAGEEFCKFYDNKISSKKWSHWGKMKNLPVNRRSFRFEEDLFDVFKKNFGATIVYDSLLWFYNPITNKNWRCFDWELEWVSVPEGFVRGRGKVKK